MEGTWINVILEGGDINFLTQYENLMARIPHRI